MYLKMERGFFIRSSEVYPSVLIFGVVVAALFEGTVAEAA